MDSALHMSMPGFFHTRMGEVGLSFFMTIIEPVREGKMPEGDDRFNTSSFEFARHGDIVGKSFLINYPWMRLDPCPFDAKSKMIDPKFFDGLKITIKFTPRKDGLITTWRYDSFFSVTIPVCFEIPRRIRSVSSIFILKRSCRSTPPKRFLGKRFQCGSVCRRMIRRWRCNATIERKKNDGGTNREEK